jgi:hypothetical protein
MSDHEQDPMPPDELRPDPRLALELHAVLGDPPVDAIDWERAYAMLAGRAAPVLDRLRRGATAIVPTWWDVAARWSRALVPLAAAASIALVALLRFTTGGDDPLASEATAQSVATLETVFATSAGTEEMAPLFLGEQTNEAYLHAALAP